MEGSGGGFGEQGKFEIDFDLQCLYHDGTLIDLDATEFRVFRVLYEASPAYLSITKILERAWETGDSPRFVEPSSVHQSIAKLRRILAAYSRSISIPSKRHRGYRLAWPGKDTDRDQFIVQKSHKVASHETPSSGPLAHLELSETHVVGFDISGTRLWSYRFPSPLRRGILDRDEWRVQLVDFHDSGNPGALVTAKFSDARKPDSIIFLKPTGEVAWMLDASSDLIDRDGGAFPRAWAFRHVIPYRTSQGMMVWAALANDAGWSGCVLRIDSLGNATTHFANGGFVEWLCPGTINTTECLVVCGENNAFDLPFAAIIGVNDAPCSSPPGGRTRYRYRNGPTGFPRKYILFPKTEVIDMLARPYGHATRMDQSEDNLIIQVEAADFGAHFRYHFTPSLEPKYVFPSGNYEFAHRELEQTHRLDHRLADCPELAQPLPLKIWTPHEGWQDGAIRWRDNPWREAGE